MAWFKVDDKFHDHKKVRMLGPDRLPALGLWTLCGSWAADHVSDGYIPRSVVKSHDPKFRFARSLVAVGMWTETTKEGEPGYQFHDWETYQPTAADLEERRKVRAESGRLGGLKAAQARRKRQASAIASAPANS